MLFDGLGSERTVTNTSGSVQGTLTLSAFGQMVASTGSSTSAYQFGVTSGRSEGDTDAGGCSILRLLRDFRQGNPLVIPPLSRGS